MKCYYIDGPKAGRSECWDKSNGGPPSEFRVAKPTNQPNPDGTMDMGHYYLRTIRTSEGTLGLYAYEWSKIEVSPVGDVFIYAVNHALRLGELCQLCKRLPDLDRHVEIRAMLEDLGVIQRR